jgi:hypothetical protein
MPLGASVGRRSMMVLSEICGKAPSAVVIAKPATPPPMMIDRI